MLGMRDDVDRLYWGMDVYVLASHREGYPRSAMEAAATGLPIVATDIRGCRQVVDHGRTGLLTPVRSPGPLAAAIGELVGDPERRAAMGVAAAARARVEFSQDRVIERTLAAYSTLPR
jgi:glycosyltransferase involved in cell wall biosynthesis